MRAFVVTFWLSVLATSTAFAAPLTLTQLNELQRYLDCQERCDAGQFALKAGCVAGCPAVQTVWDKNRDTTYTKTDYDIAVIEYWDPTQVCDQSGATVPIGACGLAACMAVPGRTAAQCADTDNDGLRAWAEAVYTTLDTVAQAPCTSGTQCNGFVEECRWLPEANKSLCMPRKCTGACTAFHLETVSQDNDELIVQVVFDYSPTPPTVLDLTINYDRTALNLTSTRALAALTKRQKNVQARHNSDGSLRLTVVGADSKMTIVPGALVELVFARTSSIQSTVSFSNDDYAQTWSLAPDPGSRRTDLTQDALWGARQQVAAASPTGDQLVLYYSFDNPQNPLDIAHVPSGQELCGRIASCANLRQTVPIEAELASKLIAQYSALQQGSVQVPERVRGVSGDAAFFDGKTDHLELPVSYRPVNERPVPTASQTRNLLTNPRAIDAWTAGTANAQTWTPNVALGLDGTSTAERAEDTLSDANAYASRAQVALGLTLGQPYSFSAFVLKDAAATVAVTLRAEGRGTAVTVSPKDGRVLASVNAVAGRVPDDYLVDDFGSHYRVQLPFVAGQVTERLSVNVGMYNAALISDANASPKPSGRAVVWGAMLEAGPYATPYKDSTGTPPPGDQSYSFSTWMYNEGTASDGGQSSPFGRVLFSHAVQAGERSQYGVLIQDQPGNVFNLAWFEGDLNSVSPIRQRIIARSIPNRQWTHVGVAIDGLRGLAWGYVDGKPAPADANGSAIPIVYGLLPTLSCPQFEPSPASGISLQQQGNFQGGTVPERIFFSSAENNLFGIEEMDANGLSRRDILRPVDSSARDADYSPVVDKIVYASSAGGSYEIYIANGDGSKPRMVTSGFGDTERGIFARRPRWAPDASAIVFESNTYNMAQRDNSWAHVYHLYYLAYDVVGGDVAVPIGGGTVSQLDYDDLVRQRVAADRLLIQDYRLTTASRHHFNAIWMRGKYRDASGSHAGEILATSSDPSWEDKNVVRFVLGAEVRDTTVDTMSFFQTLEPGAQVELMAGNYRAPAGQLARRTLLLSKEWVSFATQPEFSEFAVSVANTATAGIYEVVVTHTPQAATYAANCWDKNRDTLAAAIEDTNKDAAFTVADCYPFEIRNLYVQYNSQAMTACTTQACTVSDPLSDRAIVTSAYAVSSGKQILARKINTTMAGELIKLELLSEINNTPVPTGTEVARLRFRAAAAPTAAMVSPRIRKVRQELYTKTDDIAASADVSQPLLVYPRVTQTGFDTVNDGTFGRASTLPAGEVVDSSYREAEPLSGNLWASVVYYSRPNQPRWERVDPTQEAGLLLEGARTNLVRTSADMTGPGWLSGAGTTKSLQGPAPDGSNAANYVFGATGVRSNSTAVAATAGIASFFGRSAKNQQAKLTSGTSTSTYAFADAWSRFFTPSLGGGAGTTYFEGGVPLLDGFVWGIQVEESAKFASSYIPTQGALKTRAADVLTYLRAPLAMQSQRWAIDVYPNFASGELSPRGGATAADEPTIASFGGLPNRVSFYRNAVGTYIVVIAGGVERVAAGPLTFPVGKKLSLTFDSQAGRVTVVGSLLGDSTYQGTGWVFPEPALRMGGVFNGANELFGRLSEPRTAPIQSVGGVSPAPTLFTIAPGTFEEVFEAAFSPDAQRLVLSGLQNARPIIAKTVIPAGQTIPTAPSTTLGMQIISTSPVRTAGLDWTAVQKLYPCNWVGAIRDSTSGFYDGALRGGVDEFKLHNYLRPSAAFASEAARGKDWIAKAGISGVPVAQTTACAADSDCAEYQLCAAGMCTTQQCSAAAPCARGQCRAVPVPVAAGDLRYQSVCVSECDLDAQCFQKECRNGPCRYCNEGAHACEECRPTVKDYGSFKLEYIEGCPDRNSFACDRGSCVTECYAFDNGQSKYLCDPALEYCNQGKCVAMAWSWSDLAPASFAGLGKTSYSRPGLYDTVAVSQLYDISIEAYGVEDYLYSPEVIVEGKVTTADAAIFDANRWVEIGRFNVHNRTLNDASAKPYHLVTNHTPDILRFRMITRPYENMTNASTGLVERDKDFCRAQMSEKMCAGGTNLNKSCTVDVQCPGSTCTKPKWTRTPTAAQCTYRASGSMANLGYRITIPEYEARVTCLKRFGTQPGGAPDCGDTRDTFQSYLYGGQPAVVISRIMVGTQDVLQAGVATTKNTVCGYRDVSGAASAPNPQWLNPFNAATGEHRPLVFGSAAQEQSNARDYFYAGLDMTKLPSGLLNFIPVSGGAWGLLNCNYATATDSAANLEVRVPTLVYAATLRAMKAVAGIPVQGGINETDNGCFVEVDQMRSESCYEMVGDDASIDILSPPSGYEVNGTLTYDLFRSFGYGGQ